ncbi:LysR substrate-binding domain-containing protein (plasmid) [Eleftheria terrae]|nr:LysR substrate-binding domain-containing protein [Eleftheria terrae]WKB55734.1 LysR substrate-binding domain-containing protein [Eleftheria terrae]
MAGVVMRSPLSGRVQPRLLRNAAGAKMAAVQKPVLTVNDPVALCRATVLGLGVGLVAVPHAMPYLQGGELERLLPDWDADLGPVSLYFTSQKLLPAKTRAFVDFITEAFRARPLPQAGSAAPGARRKTR